MKEMASKEDVRHEGAGELTQSTGGGLIVPLNG